jgi:hypothetical protein
MDGFLQQVNNIVLLFFSSLSFRLYFVLYQNYKKKAKRGFFSFSVSVQSTKHMNGLIERENKE